MRTALPVNPRLQLVHRGITVAGPRTTHSSLQRPHIVQRLLRALSQALAPFIPFHLRFFLPAALTRPRFLTGSQGTLSHLRRTCAEFSNFTNPVGNQTGNLFVPSMLRIAELPR
jgi:hypothetical protein